MNVCFLRPLLLLSLLALVSGCHATRSGQMPATNTTDVPAVALGRVSTSGTGQMPSYPTLQSTLRNLAAQRYGIPVDEVLLGPIDTDGAQSIISTAEPTKVGGATVATPSVGLDPAGWSASAEVSRRQPTS